jgi:hypothetical protein
MVLGYLPVGVAGETSFTGVRTLNSTAFRGYGGVNKMQ